MRLDKFLSNAGIGTRSQVKELCKKGLVTVNDVNVKDSGIAVNETEDVVFLQGKRVSLQKAKYYMLHKPAGVVSATRDNVSQTVLELIPSSLRKDLFPVGRLDKDTTGLLLLTDDGALAHRLLAPKSHVDKEYLVTCLLPVDEQQICNLEKGVDIGEEKETMPARVYTTEDSSVIRLVIHEGKFHQVKRMMKSVGNEVIALKRLRMGSLSLDENLTPGAYRALTEEEINKLMEKDI